MPSRQNPHDFRPLPGTYSRIPPGMANYIVSLQEEDEGPQVPMKRSTLYEAGIARTARFQRRLQTWLEEQGLDAQVAYMGEPTVFPMVMLACTPEVAATIATLPGVESVIRDTEDLRVLS